MIVGIDLGTTRTKVSVLNTSGEPQLLANRNGDNFTPSVVCFNEDAVLVGTEAVNAALAHPERGVFDFKRHMGTDTVLYTDAKGKIYRAPDIAAILLKTVKSDAEARLGEPVQEVVITVPANYNNIQKQQTIEAAAQAGLKVILTLHEPTAGALGNRVHKLKNAMALSFDLGGGTFDVSLLQVTGPISEVITTGGIQKLGGRDFNERIKNKVLDEFEAQNGYRPDKNEHAVFFQDLESRVEQLKISLSSQNQSSIVATCNGDLLNMTVTREQFESWVEDLVEQTMAQTKKILQEAGVDWPQIDVIYPIGGGAMIPAIIRRLEAVSGKKVTRNCEAHCAVALGAAVAGRLEYDRLGKSYKVGSVTLPPVNYRVRDILSRPIGVLALTEEDRQVCSEILAKNTSIPSSQHRTFRLTEAAQTNVRIEILQGEEDMPAEQCVSLGFFELKDLPVQNDLVGRIHVQFDIDASGILTAIARDLVSDKKAKLQVSYKQNPLAQAS